MRTERIDHNGRLSRSATEQLLRWLMSATKLSKRGAIGIER